MKLFTLPFMIGIASCSAQSVNAAPCEILTYDKARYAVCTFDISAIDMGLYLTHSDGQPYASFDRLEADIKSKNQHLVFAMNGGMYHADRSPVGLYIEAGEELQTLNTNPGPGNFHMLPNGVFWIEQFEDEVATYRGAHVAKAETYKTDAENVMDATQSGPMLVIDGELHAKFMADSKSKKIRNGVGMDDDGNLVFAISDKPVTFHAFASLFKDKLGTPNALFLDGTISRLYSDNLDRNDDGMPMGPIIAVTRSNISEASE